MVKSRDKKTIEEKKESLADARDRMKNNWDEKSVEEIDFRNVIKRQRLRSIRSAYTKNEHLKEKLKAKQGMILFEKEGRLRKYSDRSGSGTGIQMRKNRDPMFEWKEYLDKGEDHRKKLERMNPDIVTKINEHMRLKKEEMRRRRNELGNMSIRQLTMGEKEMIRLRIAQIKMEKQCEEKLSDKTQIENKQKVEYQIEDKQSEEKQRDEIQSEKEKNAEKQCSAAEQSRTRDTFSHKGVGKTKKLDRTMDLLPNRVLCRYEQIREDNIREREDAMAKINFYESLDKTKEDIGLYSKRAKKSEGTVKEGGNEQLKRDEGEV